MAINHHRVPDLAHSPHLLAHNRTYNRATQPKPLPSSHHSLRIIIKDNNLSISLWVIHSMVRSLNNMAFPLVKLPQWRQQLHQVSLNIRRRLNL